MNESQIVKDICKILMRTITELEAVLHSIIQTDPYKDDKVTISKKAKDLKDAL